MRACSPSQRTGHLRKPKYKTSHLCSDTPQLKGHSSRPQEPTSTLHTSRTAHLRRLAAGPGLEAGGAGPGRGVRLPGSRLGGSEKSKNENRLPMYTRGGFQRGQYRREWRGSQSASLRFALDMLGTRVGHAHGVAPVPVSRSHWTGAAAVAPPTHMDERALFSPLHRARHTTPSPNPVETRITPACARSHALRTRQKRTTRPAIAPSASLPPYTLACPCPRAAHRCDGAYAERTIRRARPARAAAPPASHS